MTTFDLYKAIFVVEELQMLGGLEQCPWCLNIAT
jgi:hypothetical protein